MAAFFCFILFLETKFGTKSMLCDIYLTSPDNKARFLIGQSGPRPLYVIGINPSTASPQKLDMTLTKVSRFAALGGYEGWLMINLYAQRSTLPAGIHKRPNRILLSENLKQIKKEVLQSPPAAIWAGWGNLIEHRDWFYKELKEIFSIMPENIDWLQCGALTASGHPRHPSRLGYQSAFKSFDIWAYLNKF